MLREVFLGKSPSHFQVNPIVKAFIISESFVWAAWNFISPIFAIFAVRNIVGGQIQIAASGYSVHLLVRVIAELVIARIASSGSDRKLLLLTISGILLVTVAYIGFIFTTTIPQLFLFYAVAGLGFGIASPPKGSLFATHLDHKKATVEWGLADATSFVSIAMAAALGGFIAEAYGFRVLFVLSAIINVISVIPYTLFVIKKS
ncbi:MAG TPA: MFS transporter [Patescibacteria group bacterium]|nr:MFS transporter [Patescibacteria group bacterium]